MLIGVVSDTHDDMAAIKKAVEFLNAKGVSHVLHAGDFVSPFTFEVLGDLKAEFTGIFGNNDGDRLLLNEKSGGRIFSPPRVMTLGDKGKRSLTLAIVHEPAVVEALAASGRFNVVIYGHTHTPDIRKVNSALIINPGKVARLHKGRSTLSVLDTEKMEAGLIEL